MHNKIISINYKMNTQKTPCIYILICKDNSFYIGVTNNLDRRFIEHQEGADPRCYTLKKRPLQLVYYEFHPNFESAFLRETQLKKWSRAKKEALISGNIEKLKELSNGANQTKI